MNPRISTSMMYQSHVANMLSRQVRLEHMGQQLSSQKRLVTAKDDPVDAGCTIALERSLAALTQYGKNTNMVQSRLGLQENALENAGAAMNRAKDLTIAAGNGVLAPENRKSLAIELEKLKDTVMELANAADGNGRYLFAGAADAKAPFSNTNGEISYHGDNLRREIEIAPDTFVKDTVPGSEVFFNIGPDKQSVFSIFDRLTETLNNTAISPEDLNKALSDGLRDISLANEQFVSARTAIGVQQAHIDTTLDLRAANEVALRTHLSSIQDLDMAKAIGDYQMEQIALQASQSVYMKMQGMSLLDHMR